MRILLLMDPGIMVPPQGYGGIERLLEIFAKEYTEMGHEVHLLVTTGSEVEGCTMHAFGKEGFPPKKTDAKKAMPAAWKFLWKHRNGFDLVHNFGRLAYLIPILNHPVKKIMTYQREISNRNIRLINKLRKKNLVFTACSSDLLSRINAQGRWQVVYNAISFSKYQIQHEVAEDAPIMFLGRLEEVKGCHIAIRLAIESGDKLIIAGNISPLREEIDYFEKKILPYIDNKQIVYVGALNDAQKNHYLGISKAFIFPIEWNEPFGIVMIEAMACGTPVVAFNKGAVNEVIDEGITGYKVNSFNEMLEAVKRIKNIDRKRCGEYAKKRFDATLIALQYVTLFKAEKKNIVIVTTGQPAANPRVMKEYEALKQSGYRVKVLYTYSAEWSHKIDSEKFSKGELKQEDFVLVGGNPGIEKITYFFSRLWFRFLRILSSIIPFFFFRQFTIARSSMYLWLHAKKYRSDIYIAHYLGALPAAIRASSKYRSPVIFDAEDFHRGEEPYYSGQLRDVKAIEDKLLPRVNLITTASPLISAAYMQLYPGKEVVTINNVFSVKYLQKAIANPEGKLKLFWFSQNIGPNRGLETIVDALNFIEEDISLTLLGNVRSKAYVEQLLKRSKYPDRIHFISPVRPEQIFEKAAAFDIGIAAEIPYCINRDICLTNKIFTYLLAGNCMLASDTTAQKDFISNHQDVGLIYKNNDAVGLSILIKKLSKDRNALLNCKINSLKLTEQTLNWEIESKKLITIIETL